MHAHIPPIGKLAPKVFEARWWMALFGSITPKRHVAWSNAKTVALLDLGVLAKDIRKKLSQHSRQSTKKTVSKRGKRQFAGTRFLKGTQILNSTYLSRVCGLALVWVSNILKSNMIKLVFVK